MTILICPFLYSSLLLNDDFSSMVKMASTASSHNVVWRKSSCRHQVKLLTENICVCVLLSVLPSCCTIDLRVSPNSDRLSLNVIIYLFRYYLILAVCLADTQLHFLSPILFPVFVPSLQVAVLFPVLAKVRYLFWFLWYLFS